jgi:hypothetical protein
MGDAMFVRWGDLILATSLSGLAFVRPGIDYNGMRIPGHVKNGVVVLQGGRKLPEGAKVTVFCRLGPGSQPSPKKKRVQLPLVQSTHPSSLRLSNERIAEILEAEELASFRKSLRKPTS